MRSIPAISTFLATAFLVMAVLQMVGCSEATQSIDREIEQAWFEAGAERGWVGESEYQLKFDTTDMHLSDPLPGFKFSQFSLGTLKDLPEPNAPFGLQLERSGADGLAMRDLSDLKELRYLSVWDTDVDNDGLRALVKLKSLKKLELGWTKVSDPGLIMLSGLTELEFLSLYGCADISGTTLAQLSKLSKLKYLDLGETSLTDDYAASVAELKSITQLRISDTQITNAGLKEIVKLPNLEVLIMEYMPVTDNAIPTLSKISTLKEVYLTGTEITQAGVDDLKAALPNCTVDFAPPKKDDAAEDKAPETKAEETNDEE